MKSIGGQAVIEGVMMKSPQAWTVAVRGPRGDIQLKKAQLKRLPRTLTRPVIRGVVALYHALSIGIKALEFSAAAAFDETDEKPLGKPAIALTIGVSVLLGIGLFIVLPLYAAKLLGSASATVEKSSAAFNLVDGLVRVFIFILYIVLIGLWGEMRRIFEYHGAEHKVIHAFESGRDLDIEGIKLFSPLHPRCGTSFLMIVMIMSILIFSFIPQSWSFAMKLASRLVLIPVIAGVSYEALKLSAKLRDNPAVRLLVAPGLALQRLTTREPDEKQIEVALVALKEVLSMEEGRGD
jgi:uncharacterized protein YqhQ